LYFIVHGKKGQNPGFFSFADKGDYCDPVIDFLAWLTNHELVHSSSGLNYTGSELKLWAVLETEQENTFSDLFFLFDLMQYIARVGTKQNELCNLKCTAWISFENRLWL